MELMAWKCSIYAAPKGWVEELRSKNFQQRQIEV